MKLIKQYYLVFIIILLMGGVTCVRKKNSKVLLGGSVYGTYDTYWYYAIDVLYLSVLVV